MGILVGFLITIGIIIWIISSIITFFQKTARDYSESRKKQQEIENKYPISQIDKTKSLEERNEIVINDQLNLLRKDTWPHYIENKVADCIREIAQREHVPSLAPRPREWLPIWEGRQGIPKEYLDLKKSLLLRFKEKYGKILVEDKQKQDLAEREYKDKKEQETSKFLEGKKDIIEKFLEIAERKVSVIDDYGDESWDALNKEIESCVRKIAKMEGINDDVLKDFFKKGYGWKLPDYYTELPSVLEKLFKDYHDSRKGKSLADVDLNNLSGIEFETHLSKVFRNSGYDVSGTPVTGDQGADLLAKKDGKTLVIQAKRYQGSVGNKAVQEVVSAISFYNGDEGWVITNSTFTPSAKALAQKNSVKLIDGFELSKLQDLI
jgi:HJR/Mrr/RecB family endonuclease